MTLAICQPTIHSGSANAGVHARANDLWQLGSDAVNAENRELAVQCFRELTTLQPWWPDHHWSLGNALLALGDYANGFAKLEWRWHPRLNGNAFDKELERRGVPRWAGESLAGKSIVFYQEWGLGDTIMMARYALEATKAAHRVAVVANRSLVRLIEQQGMASFDAVPDQRFDFRCPLFSAPNLMGFWPLERPYIKAAGATSRLPPRPRMGIAWSGNRRNCKDAVRSIELGEFLRLLGGVPHNLISLQKHDNHSADAYGVHVPQVDDFADLAALMMQMDCIVTVDTAAAHLAGAIGHPNATVLLYRPQHWPWYRAKDWYPTLKCATQHEAGDWPSAFAGLNFA